MWHEGGKMLRSVSNALASQWLAQGFRLALPTVNISLCHVALRMYIFSCGNFKRLSAFPNPACAKTAKGWMLEKIKQSKFALKYYVCSWHIVPSNYANFSCYENPILSNMT